MTPGFALYGVTRSAVVLATVLFAPPVVISATVVYTLWSRAGFKLFLTAGTQFSSVAAPSVHAAASAEGSAEAPQPAADAAVEKGPASSVVAASPVLQSQPAGPAAVSPSAAAPAAVGAVCAFLPSLVPSCFPRTCLPMCVRVGLTGATGGDCRTRRSSRCWNWLTVSHAHTRSAQQVRARVHVLWVFVPPPPYPRWAPSTTIC